MLLLPLLIAAFAFRSTQQVTITGRVTDESGSPITGVSVTAGKTGTATDRNGKYKLVLFGNEKELSFSAVGYNTIKMKVAGKKVINAVLHASNTALEEVVVVGAYNQRKSVNISGASAAVSQANISYGLAGKVSGLQVSGNGFSQQYRLNSDKEDEGNTEAYSTIAENGFKKALNEPVSTFSIDVDAASYSNVRRYLNNNQLPPAGAVRTEEMINYFKYQYPQPSNGDPFSINTEISDCPWNKSNKLVLIGLQGKNIPAENLPASNLVFLIDVSGSMQDENKLPLVKASMRLLADQLREQDRISIVVYAGNAGLVLPATSGANKIKIKTAIDALEAGGSTAGGEGILLAYKTARNNMMKNGNNRIILCTDGDFNVGASSDDDMVRLVEKERHDGIYLTVLGYGMGNYKDSKMEQLADKGNGNHAYIDGINEAKKVLVTEFGGTLFTIAKDVKLQLEFNPEKVAGYRLIGYENRLLNKEDFNDDKKDAGELGSGHTVTALYEIIPAGISSPFLKETDPLKYQNNKKAKSDFSDELLTVKFRYKAPGKETSALITHPVIDKGVALNSTSDNFRFAMAVSGFAMLLRNSEFKGTETYSDVLHIANSALGKDAEGYRKEFVTLVKKAEEITNSKAAR